MKSFILLDRSGSMSVRWEETKSALDSYINGLDPKIRVWLAAFDTDFDLVLDGDRAANWSGLPKSICPSSLTSLFDAISKINRHVIDEGKKKAQIVILTDGAENSSRETSKSAAKAIVDSWRDRGYDVVYLGADFDGMSEARSVGVGTGQTLNYKSLNAAATGVMLAGRAANYQKTGKIYDWTAAERRRASA